MTPSRQGSVRKRHARACASHQGGRCRCSGTWQFRARLPGGERVEQGGFTLKSDAESALRDLLRAAERGTYRRVEPMGFDEYATAWLEQVEPTIRPSTHASYSQIVRTHLEPWFGATILSAITTAHVRSFVASKSAARRPKDGEPVWSAATVRNMLVVMKMILAQAVEDGYAATNVAAAVKPPKIERVEKIVLTDAELDRVIAVAGEPWATLFAFLSWSGCRRGEALGLRWTDLDLSAGRVFVRTTHTKFGDGPPKSAAGRRTVPITPAMVVALRRHQLAQPPDGDDDGGRVFRSQTGGAIDPDHVGRAWRRAIRKAGVRSAPMKSLRDVAASRMISAGGSIKTVQTTIGHASPMLTLSTYGHLLEDDLDRLAERLADLSQRDPAGDPNEPTEATKKDPEGTSPITRPSRDPGQQAAS